MYFCEKKQLGIISSLFIYHRVRRQNKNFLCPLLRIGPLCLTSESRNLWRYLGFWLWGRWVFYGDLPLSNGIPSHHATGYVFWGLDSRLFNENFLSWVKVLLLDILPDIFWIGSTYPYIFFNPVEGILIDKSIILWSSSRRPAGVILLYKHYFTSSERAWFLVGCDISFCSTWRRAALFILIKSYVFLLEIKKQKLDIFRKKYYF